MRDLELLRSLSTKHELRIALSLCALRPELARLIDGKAPLPKARLKAMRALSGAGLKVTALVMPVMPGINDSNRDLLNLLRAVAAHGGSAAGGQLVFLRGTSRERFFLMLEEKFPHLVPLYRESFAHRTRFPRSQQEAFHQRFHALRKRAGLSER